MKIGIFGGTFDPIHLGHIEIVKAAVSELCLDKALIIPAGNPYFKSHKRDILPAIHRYNMIKFAIRPYPYMEALDIELNKEGETYTVDTLKKLNESYKSDELFFIVGSDSLIQMDSWFSPQGIFDLCTIVCAKRDDDEIDDTLSLLKDKYNADIHVLSDKYWKGNASSSSSIREKLLEGDYSCLDNRVSEYIKKYGLYTKNISIDQIKNRLQLELTPHRYAHSLGVADSAYDLALAHGYKDPDKAYLAGLLHDAGKPYADALSHAPKGAEIAKKYYGIDDEEVLLAISSHTLGREDMSELEIIVFLADFIEPGREYFEGLEEIRALSYMDYNRAIVLTIERTISYLNSRNQYVDEKTLQVYNYYKQKAYVSRFPEE